MSPIPPHYKTRHRSLNRAPHSGGVATPTTENLVAFQLACDDMKGKYMTLDVKEFLKKLPLLPSDLPMPAKPLQAPKMLGLEPTHYVEFKEYMSPFIHSNWEFVITSENVDRDFDDVFGANSVKPDMILYDHKGTSNTVMKKAGIIGEFKVDDAPFYDENGTVKENDADMSRLSRGQLTLYSSIVLSAQPRTRLYSFYVQRHNARLLCHSRAGFEVTPLFDYVQTSYLQEFFWRYTHASAEDRGCDTTMRSDLGTEDEEHVKEARLKLKVAAGKPIFKVMVQKMPFYLSEPFIFRHNQPTGRGTRCFEAYYPAEKRLVLLKDTWRHVEYRPEGKIYEELHAAQVPNILPVVAEEDVEGELHRAEVSTEDGPRKFIHYRIVLGSVGRPLSEFRSSHELVKACADAFEAHFCAWRDLEMLHRDVSSGNIILGPIEDDPQGYLIDWEFATKGSNNMKSRERTGTYEFMSVRLLKAIPSNDKVRHEAQDDIESFVYVLAWIVISHAVSDMNESTRQKLRDEFMRQPQNDTEATIRRRSGVIMAGVDQLQITTAQLKRLLGILFKNLSYRLLPRTDVVANLLDAFADEESPEQKANLKADERIRRMTTHANMRAVLRNALKDEAWKNEQDPAVPLTTPPPGTSNKRRGGALNSGRDKRTRGSRSSRSRTT
ncbi:hypothetical protein BT69DRAFT_1263670 [Atractiella rhizophila]|nr:hypothetical protein BT69DRAFT_1263670 [Atractiella rhizophila]